MTVRVRLLHPMVVAAALLAAALAVAVWALLAGDSSVGDGGVGVPALALLVAGAAAGFANSGST